MPPHRRRSRSPCNSIPQKQYHCPGCRSPRQDPPAGHSYPVCVNAPMERAGLIARPSRPRSRSSSPGQAKRQYRKSYYLTNAHCPSSQNLPFFYRNSAVKDHFSTVIVPQKTVFQASRNVCSKFCATAEIPGEPTRLRM